MTFPTRRLDRLTYEVRVTVVPEELTSGDVFHYSIPSIESVGDGEVERAGEIKSAKLVLKGGEVLVSRLNPRKMRVLTAESHEVPTVASGEFVAVVPKAIDPEFLLYALHSEVLRQYLDMHAQSVTRSHQRVRPGIVMRMPVPLPDPVEQVAIASHLDAETARIDALIEKKRRLSGKLAERRAAITDDVLDSDASRVKLTLVAHLGTGHTPSREHPEWWEDCTIPWITTGEVPQMRADRIEVIRETRESISEIGLRNSAAELHPAGTVVLSRTASAGYSAIMGGDMATSQDFVTWACGPSLRPRYLLLCLRAMRQDLLGRLAMGSTHKTIYMPDIESIRVPLPPVEEQNRIVDDVWSRLRPIDAVVDKLDRQIALLQEHRQALITAAVTGELEVAA